MMTEKVLKVFDVETEDNSRSKFYEDMNKDPNLEVFLVINPFKLRLDLDEDNDFGFDFMEIEGLEKMLKNVKLTFRGLEIRFMILTLRKKSF